MLADPKKIAAWPRGDRCFSALSAYTVCMAGVQVVTIALSLAEVTISAPMAAGVLMVSAAGGCLAFRLGPRTPAEAPGEGRPPEARRWWLAMAAIIPAAIYYLAVWTLACSRPDLSCDGNTYHIPTVHIWAMKGYVHWVSPGYQAAQFMNGFPKGVEVLAFVLVKAFGVSNLVNAPNLVLLPLGVLGVACLARMLGASGAMAALAGAAYAMIPVNISQGPTTYVDSGYASCAVAFVASLVFVQSRLSRPGSFLPFFALPALGASAGLAMAGKTTGGLIVLVGLAMLSVVIAARAFSGGPGRGRRLAGGAGYVLLAILIAAAVGGYWYVRNYLIMRSPLYPVGLTVAGHRVFPGADIAQTIGVEECPPDVIRFLPGYQKVLYAWSQIGVEDEQWPATIWFLDTRLGGLGYIWLLGCVPAIAVLLVKWTVRPRTGRLGLLLGLLVVTGATFAATPMNWWARLTLWIYALGLPCFAVGATWAFGRRSGPRAAPAGAGGEPARSARPRRGLVWPFRIWVAACVLVVLAEAGITLLLNVAWAKCPDRYKVRLLLKGLWQESWDRPTCCLMPELSGTVFDEILAGDAGVAVGRLDGQQLDSEAYKVEILGPLSLPIGRRAVVPVGEPVDESAVAALRAQKIRYVVLDETFAVPEVLLRATVRADRPPGFWVLTLDTE